MDIAVLGIETSCDETAASVVVNGRTILSNVISSQAALHEKYGGVVPEAASRRHVENIIPVIDSALEESGKSLSDIDVIGVTCGPGLVGALLTGVTAAKGLALAESKPLVGVHHIEGHICANYLNDDPGTENDLEPPFICLVVSGGHSHIIHVKSHGDYEVLGRTRDDAAGEAFDKAARAMGLGYPGGPAVDRAAAGGDPGKIAFPETDFGNGSLDFSFSGVKTALLNYLEGSRAKKKPGAASGYRKGIEAGEAVESGDVNNAAEVWTPDGILIPEDVAASFQRAVVNVLVRNTLAAAVRTGLRRVCLAGGVASNSELRKTITQKGNDIGLEIHIPGPVFCTDNAAMIASAAYYKYINGKRSGLSLNAEPSLKLGSS